MSSVTDGEPEHEGSELADARPGRGRGRRGRLWGRKDDDLPIVGDLDADEVAELLRRSNTSLSPETEPLAEADADRWSDVIDRSLGRPLATIDPEEFEAAPPASEDPTLRGTLTDRMERMRVETPADDSDAADAAEAQPEIETDEVTPEDWTSVITRATSRPFGDTLGIRAPEEPAAAAPETEPENEPEVEAEVEPEVEAEPVAEARHELPDQRSTAEEAGQRVIAAAVDAGFAEPTPVVAPKGLARLRRKPGAAAGPKREARATTEYVEPPLLEEPIPNIDQPADVPRRPAEVLAHARAEIEAELAPAPAP
ncbi:hypothetical protein, partial [Nocardioides ginsengisoli]